MTGRTYLLHGEPVTVLAMASLRRRDLPVRPPWLIWHRPPKYPPRNAAIRRSDGTRTVRPFRGLRRPPTRGQA